MTDRPPLPPFDLEGALAKVQAAEDAWSPSGGSSVPVPAAERGLEFPIQ